MRKIVDYCNKCEKIIDGKAYIYTVSYEDKYFKNTMNIYLCRKCAEKFHRKYLHTKEEIPNW